MMEIADTKRLLILKILCEDSRPQSSQLVRERLEKRGLLLSERTVRFHMLALDKAGLTEYKGKKGRFPTAAGYREIARNQAYDRVGFMSSRIDELSCQMDFDWRKKTGTVLINVSLIPLENTSVVYHLMAPVFESALTMGQKVAIFRPGEKVGSLEIPPRQIGLGTVCSITLNGIFLKAGIPVTSIFGGVLEVFGKQPDRFTAIINYDGTSLDPLEIFISSGMTDCKNAAEAGHGFIAASFREIPASCLERVVAIHEELCETGLGGILKVGYAGHSLLGIPVADGRIGLIIPAGMNSVSALVVEYKRLIHYKDLYRELKQV